LNYDRHRLVLGIIVAAGFVLFLFSPQYGSAIMLPALGAYLAADQTKKTGASQPSYLLWLVFFALVAVAVIISYLLPGAQFWDFDSTESIPVLQLVYLGCLILAFPLFGYLAYRQRVGRQSS